MDLLNQKLHQLNRKIRVGIIGIGSIGKGILLQATITPGFECVAIADIDLEKAVNWAKELKLTNQIVGSPLQMQKVIEEGTLAICQDGEWVASSEAVDVLIEASSSVPAGGQFAITGLENGKHVVMMNYEAELMFGPYLLNLAHQNNLVYTCADGDQPVAIKRLADEIEFMGFQLVMAGNIKGYLDRYTNPTLIIPEAEKRDLDNRMCASYTDGTKLNIEMAVVANGMGLKTPVPGMLGPRLSDISEVLKEYDFEALWDGKQGLVDYVLGAKPHGGVFVIGYTTHFHQQKTLAWFPSEVGPGPFYFFYRPFHLGHFETMRSVAEAFLDGYAALKPDFGYPTDVIAYAKKDLHAGEMLDGIGGYTCYGLIENLDQPFARSGLPVCLTEQVMLKRAISKDERIRLEDIHVPSDRFDFALHAKSVATRRNHAP